jgi:methylated-DNA-[protein]-cysteine S-methyltransferase
MAVAPIPSKRNDSLRLEELTRFLIPSPIGVVGVELHGEIITHVAIVPKGRERKSFTEFAKLKRSDFLDEVLGRFSEYFAGARRDLSLEYSLDSWNLDKFSKRVLRQAAKIRYGDRRTYQQIATSAGRPGAYRNVLAILVENPLPIVIPCHRVTTAKSGVGSYIAGSRKKEWLLKMERREMAANRF